MKKDDIIYYSFLTLMFSLNLSGVIVFSVFCILKLNELISISWFWIWFSLWIMPSITIALLFLFAILGLMAALKISSVIYNEDDDRIIFYNEK